MVRRLSAKAHATLHRYLEGVRYGLGFPWHKMLPDKVYVRVLDRDGKPVPGANLKWWYCSPGDAT